MHAVEPGNLWGLLAMLHRTGRVLLAATSLSVLAGIALTAPALAADPPPEPATVSGFLAIDGKQIPLPTGDWVVAGRAVHTPEGLSGSEAVTSLGLLRLRQGRAEAAVLVQLASPGASTVWGQAPGCERSDLPIAKVRYGSDHDGACAWVAAVTPGDAVTQDPAWVATVEEARRRGWRLPASWAMAGFRISDPRDAVQIRYAFAAGPELPDTAWVETAWNRIDLGFRNRLSGMATPIPDWQANPAAATAVTADSEGGLGRTVWKTITFRSLVTTLDFSSNYVALGDLAAAAGLSAFGFVIGPFVYLGHEMAWEKFGGQSAKPVELPGLGEEGPPAATGHRS